MSQKIKNELMNRLKRATRAMLTDEYLSPGGILKTKGPAAKGREYTAVEMWSEAVWIANNRHATPFHFQMKAHGEVTAEKELTEQFVGVEKAS